MNKELNGKSLIGLLVIVSSRLAVAAPLPFSVLSPFHIGQTTMDQAKLIVGEPEGVLPMKRVNEIGWLYFDSKQTYSPRLVLRFDERTKILKIITWSVRETDPEYAVPVAQSKFENAHFQKITKTRLIDDIVDTYSYFQDRRLGVGLLLDEDRKNVASVSWGDLPSERKAASSEVEIVKNRNFPMPDSFFEEIRKNASRNK